MTLRGRPLLLALILTRASWIPFTNLSLNAVDPRGTACSLTASGVLERTLLAGQVDYALHGPGLFDVVLQTNLRSPRW